MKETISPASPGSDGIANAAHNEHRGHTMVARSGGIYCRDCDENLT